MKSIQRGFTLIQWMIVVAIIGILAAVAVHRLQRSAMYRHGLIHPLRATQSTHHALATLNNKGAISIDITMPRKCTVACILGAAC